MVLLAAWYWCPAEALLAVSHSSRNVEKETTICRRAKLCNSMRDLALYKPTLIRTNPNWTNPVR